MRPRFGARLVRSCSRCSASTAASHGRGLDYGRLATDFRRKASHLICFRSVRGTRRSLNTRLFTARARPTSPSSKGIFHRTPCIPRRLPLRESDPRIGARRQVLVYRAAGQNHKPVFMSQRKGAAKLASLPSFEVPAKSSTTGGYNLSRGAGATRDTKALPILLTCHSPVFWIER